VKAKEARSAADETREAVKGVRLAVAEARKPREEPDRAAKDNKLPFSDRIRWDDSLLNNKKDFTLVRQRVEDKEIKWTVEINSDEGVHLATRATFVDPFKYIGNCRIHVQYLDEDDVEILRSFLSPTGSVAKGEPVSLTLVLPKDGIPKATKKIV